MGNTCCSTNKSNNFVSDFDIDQRKFYCAQKIQNSFRAWKSRNLLRLSRTVTPKYFFHLDLSKLPYIPTLSDLMALQSKLARIYVKTFTSPPRPTKPIFLIKSISDFKQQYKPQMHDYLSKHFSFYYTDTLVARNDKLLTLFNHLTISELPNLQTEQSETAVETNIILVDKFGKFIFQQYSVFGKSVESFETNKAYYIGNVSKKRPDGFCLEAKKSGSIFIGFFKDGKRNGPGIEVEEKQVYEGEFRENKRNGFGWLRESNKLYKGFFKDGKKCGIGKISGKQTYVGCFKEDEYCFVGFYDGNKEGSYCGEFSMGSMNGEGYFDWRNGFNYLGSWVNGKMEGKGRYQYANNDWYEGEFLLNEKHGEGAYFSKKDGKVTKGKWSKGKKVGRY